MGASLASYRAWGRGLSSDLALGVERALLLAGWAWTGGRLVGLLSRQTLWASLLAVAAPCAFCLSRFRVPDTSPLSLLLFLIPAAWGLVNGVRSVRPCRGFVVPLAIGVTLLTIGLLMGRGSISGPKAWIWDGLLCLPAWVLAGAARAPLRSARWSAAILAIGGLGAAPDMAAASEASRVLDTSLRSEHLAHSKIGTDPVRRLAIYFPPGYDGSSRRLPVIYFFPNSFGSYRACFDQRGAQALFDHAIADGVIGKFVFVTVDMNTPLGCSWYVNSPVTGDWEAFFVDDLVPYVDAHFRTLANRESRGLAGDFMGGYGALRIGMEHPELFGSVYALHPVGTGSGVQTMYSRPNWDALAGAKSLDDAKTDGVTQIFTAIFQAHLPDIGKPPLYIDLPAHREGGQIIADAKQVERLREAFFIESIVPRYADNLKSLRGLKFDWARSDANQDHVYSNQALTHKLNEFGIVHEAEEYNGAWGEPNWGDDGRIATELLPFFKRHLATQL
jgi:enterochelin esterase-like enzyme